MKLSHRGVLSALHCLPAYSPASPAARAASWLRWDSRRRRIYSRRELALSGWRQNALRRPGRAVRCGATAGGCVCGRTGVAYTTSSTNSGMGSEPALRLQARRIRVSGWLHLRKGRSNASVANRATLPIFSHPAGRTSWTSMDLQRRDFQCGARGLRQHRTAQRFFTVGWVKPG
jgi:hypothetical protein